eukprot:PhM_4_TR2226/c0_g1_i1/m.60484
MQSLAYTMAINYAGIVLANTAVNAFLERRKRNKQQEQSAAASASSSSAAATNHDDTTSKSKTKKNEGEGFPAHESDKTETRPTVRGGICTQLTDSICVCWRGRKK